MFLDPEMSERQKYYPSSDLERKDQETESVENETHKEKEEVKEDVIQNPEFSNVAWNVASEVSSKYTDMEQLKRDRKRFQERLKSKNSTGEEYIKVWEKKIRDGFDHLIKLLEENKYFDDCKDSEAKTQKIADVMVQYSKEVHNQYEKSIWSAGNKTFNKVKDTIFWADSEDYPANKIYTQLTGATTISKTDRTHIEWYESEILDWTDIEDSNENMSDRQNRNFLSNDLPEYLWGIRKTPAVLNVMKWLPIFSVKEDRPSKVDRKAIKQFLKTSSRINIEWNKDKALALMEVFHDSSLNTSSGEKNYKEALAKHGVSVDDKYIDDIVKAWNFYMNTQNSDNSARNQHAIYLSVLKIIETEGGVVNAANKYKSIVEQSKKDKKTEKKEGYQTGEKLWEINPELYEIAKRLKITDFTSATRLAEKRSEYFWNTPVEKILANLNNDEGINAWDTIDGGTKTWSQFLEIFKQVWKEKALPNLVEHARLLNKTLWIGLPDQLFNADTIEEDIKGGHTWLILLLQNIISNPGEDLYTLLSGHKEDPFEWLDLKAEKEKADKTAAEMVRKMNFEALNKDGLRLPTPESMQTGLSTALYTEYKRWVWLWGKISFDEWLKWVEMNTGFQVRGDGTVIIWIWLDYSKRINLWKWWSTTPELSAWAFIPLGMWKPELSGSVWLNDEVAKERITKKWIQQHLGLSVGATLMPAGVVVVSAWINWSQDKLVWVEAAEQKKMVEFRDQIMGPILTKAFDKRKFIKSPLATKIDFNSDTKPTREETFKEAILEVAQSKDEKGNILVPEDKQEMVTDAVMRLLVNYNGEDLAKEGVREVIAQWIAEQYAMAWAEDRKAHITDKTYLSWASLGVFWVVGSPLVWIYGGVKFTKHDKDGYGDRGGHEYEDQQEYIWEWNQEKLDKFNQQLGLSWDKAIKLGNWFIVIPKSIAYRVNVNEKMRWLMKRDKNWNILIHTQTPMMADLRRWAATQWGEIFIWWRKGNSYAKLDQVDDARFTNEDINQNEVLELGEGINTYSVEILDKALDAIKNKAPEGDPIRNFDFSNYWGIEDVISKLNALDKTKKAKLLVVSDNEWNVSIKGPEEWDEWRWLDIKYMPKFEMIDPKAKNIANEVYAEALKIRDQKILNAVKHDKPKHRPEYDPFNAAMQSKDYQAAREALKPIFAKLDKQIAGAKFTEIWNKLDELEWDALAQALMSINNIFARSVKVVWWGSEYKFTISMWDIIWQRENEISRTIKNYNGENITPEIKAGYQSLIDASAKYRKNSKIFDKKMSAKAAQLNNTVWFNLWDRTNPENPLFNPEIYDPMVDLKELEGLGFDEKSKNTLHERAMKLFADNDALINPILKYFGLDGKDVKVGEFSVDWEKWKLTLDIWWKIITLRAWMKFGYFTQCVNHTVILDDISAETQDGASVSFNSGVWENNRIKETNKSSIDATVERGVHGSVIVHDGREEKEPPKKEDTTTDPEETKREKHDQTTNPEETKREKKSDATSNPWAENNGKVDTGWKVEQWWDWDKGKQSWEREWWDWDKKQWWDWQKGHQEWWGPAW